MGDSTGRIRSDLRRSFFFGPARFVVPIVGYALIYPLLIGTYGAEALGLWAILLVIPQTLAISDMGFSLLITREATRESSAEFLQMVAWKHKISKRFYTIFIVSLIPIVIGSYVMWLSENVPYEARDFGIAIALMLVAVLIQLSGGLDSAVLKARNDTHFVHSVNGLCPVLLYGSALFGIAVGFPLIFLSVGYILSNAFAYVAYKKRLVSCHDDWIVALRESGLEPQSLRFGSLVRQSKHLYSTSVGMLVRDPALRVAITFVAGLEGVAAFEIAMRVCRTLREVVGIGFMSLYGAFAELLARSDGINEIVEYSTNSLFLLFAVGGSAILCFLNISPWFYSNWLGSELTGLVEATYILGIWSVVTLVNVPFWYLLLASRQEIHNSRAIWLQTLSVFLIFPASLYFDFELTDALWVFVVSSLLTQCYVLIIVEIKHKILRRIFSDPKILITVAVVGFVQAAVAILAVGELAKVISAISLSSVSVGVLLIVYRRHLQDWLRI